MVSARTRSGSRRSTASASTASSTTSTSRAAAASTSADAHAHVPARRLARRVRRAGHTGRLRRDQGRVRPALDERLRLGREARPPHRRVVGHRRRARASSSPRRAQSSGCAPVVPSCSTPCSPTAARRRPSAGRGRSTSPISTPSTTFAATAIERARRDRRADPQRRARRTTTPTGSPHRGRTSSTSCGSTTSSPVGSRARIVAGDGRARRRAGSSWCRRWPRRCRRPARRAYAAAKAALSAYFEALATELWSSGVRFHLVYPALIELSGADGDDSLADTPNSGDLVPAPVLARAMMRQVERDELSCSCHTARATSCRPGSRISPGSIEMMAAWYSPRCADRGELVTALAFPERSTPRSTSSSTTSPTSPATLHELRGRKPALWGRGFGQPALLLLSHELVNAAFKDEDVFPSAEFYGNVVTDVLGRNLQCMYGDEHRVNRALVSPAFRQRLMPGLVAAAARAGRARADRPLRRRRARPTSSPTSPAATRSSSSPACSGCPRHSEAEVKRWAMGMLDIQNRYDDARAVLARVHGVRRPDPPRAARRNPGDDLHLDARDHRGRRPAAHRRGDLQLPAAAVPRRRRHHLPRARVARSTRCSRTPTSSRSSARTPPSDAAGPRRGGASASTRRPRGSRGVNPRDVVWHDIEIPAGASMFLGVMAANRDPAVFPDPDRFDVTRHPTPVMTFGFGTHFCLGAHLARAEIDVALRVILERLPEPAPARDRRRADHRHDPPPAARPQPPPRRLRLTRPVQRGR